MNRCSIDGLRQALEVVGEGVLILGAGYHLVFINHAARVMLGAEADALPGGRVLSLVGQPIGRLLEAAERLGSAQETIVAPGRSQAWLVRAHPMRRSEQGQGWVVTLRDLSWEGQVQRRRQTQERLAMVGQLAASAAHDVRGVLQGIVSLVDLLRYRSDLPDSLRSPVQSLHQQVRQADALIGRMLHVSRSPVSGKRPLDLGRMVDETMKLWRLIIPKAIEVRYCHEGEACWVEGNAIEVHQVLLNLLTNARDAMAKGGTLEVSLRRLALMPGQEAPLEGMPAGQWVLLVVSDSGSGIDPKDLPRVFDAFFSTRPADRGTGLGLSQVRIIVARHGGFLGVQTEVGRGTTFHIYLPARERGGAG